MGLSGIQQAHARPTWRGCVRNCSAVLDRAWCHSAILDPDSLCSRWLDSGYNLDHALIYLDITQRLGCIGFAGACSVNWGASGRPRIRVDLRRLTERRYEWAFQVQQRLCEIRDQLPTNPFDALAAALCAADELAYDEAPRACSAEGWSSQQPFAFRGHAALKCEVH
jgi:hypothetical protein